MRKTAFTIVLLVLCQLVTVAQESSTVSSNRATADSLFAQKNYSEALPIFTELLSQTPQDQLLMYFTGVCNLLGGHHLQLAQELLANASSGEVPNLVNYYLGEAYRLGYQFDKAVDCYRRYTVNGVLPEANSERVEKVVGYCENGGYITRYIYKPTVFDAQVVARNEVYEFLTNLPPSGGFTYVPKKLRSEIDKKHGYKPLMFYPTAPEVGDYIYFSSYGKTGETGTDIYRTQFLGDDLWSEPEALSNAVNTPADEAFPYLAPDGKTLYFASNGHYGMGGYDVYRSVYNKVAQQWSPAENLGFPFSSPYDDYLCLPTQTDSIITFVTDRKCLNDSVLVALVLSNDKQVRRTAESAAQIADYASLKLKEQPAKTSSKTKKVASKSQSAKASQPQKTASFRAVERDPEYSRTIAKGFEEQMKADSARVKLEKLREKFDFVETAEQRIKLEKKVTAVENAMLEAQKQADQMFVRASQIEQEYLTGKRKPGGRSELTFATDNPKYIFQAQFATTVFQDDEIAKLARAEQLYPEIVKARKTALEQRSIYRACCNHAVSQISVDTTKDKVKAKQVTVDVPANYDLLDLPPNLCENDSIKDNDTVQIDSSAKNIIKEHADNQQVIDIVNNNICEPKLKAMHEAMQAYTARFTQHFDLKWPIYDDCINVAVVKSGTDVFQTREIIKTSTVQLRAATAILNNLTDEGRIESEFEAAQLRELALVRMDYVFAKVWGMELMEKRMAKQVVAFENQLFGTSKLALDLNLEPDDGSDDELSQYPKIERVSLAPPIKSFKVKWAIPADFGVVDTMVYSDANPIPIIRKQPAGVVYRIQIGAYASPRKPLFFKHMVPVVGIRTGKVIKYFVGCLSTLAEAENALQTVKKRGFKDAFVMAWYNGKTVTLSRAKSLENIDTEDETSQSGSRKSATNDSQKDDKAAASKVYMVQIGAYKGAMPADDLKTVKTLVAGKEILRKIDEHGNYVYSVGSFNNLDEAEKIKDNLVASGMLKAAVVSVDI